MLIFINDMQVESIITRSALDLASVLDIQLPPSRLRLSTTKTGKAIWCAACRGYSTGCGIVLAHKEPLGQRTVTSGRWLNGLGVERIDRQLAAAAVSAGLLPGQVGHP